MQLGQNRFSTTMKAHSPRFFILDHMIHLYKLVCFFLLALAIILIFTFYPPSQHLWSADGSVDYLNSLTFQCSGGQLGNKMFFYAMVYGLSKLNNRQGYVQNCNTCIWTNGKCSPIPLQQVFELTMPVGPDLTVGQIRGHKINFHITYPNDYHISPVVNVLIGEQFPISVTHFLHVKEEIRKEFKFRKPYENHADAVLRGIRGNRKNVTFVGVHVRRGSFLPHLKKLGRENAPGKFYTYAMKFFRRRLPNAVFVVLSDDLPWCKQNLAAEDVFIASGMSGPAEDLAVLSSCNHTIFDYGAYGFWSAFLSGGTALYFVDGTVDDSEKDPINAQKMYPPEWIGITGDMVFNCA